MGPASTKSQVQHSSFKNNMTDQVFCKENSVIGPRAPLCLGNYNQPSDRLTPNSPPPYAITNTNNISELTKFPGSVDFVCEQFEYRLI